MAPEVFARRHVMQIISEQATLLEAMASGRMSFDGRVARIAAGEISEYARQLPGLYDADGTEGQSATTQAIRADIIVFGEQSMRLAMIAEAACEDIETLADLRGAHANMQETCRSCHAWFRK